jgi:Putative MetA-pathway of phenol degradation
MGSGLTFYTISPMLPRPVGLALALWLGLAPTAPTVASAARPLDTEDTGTTEQGRFELELGAEHAQGDGTHAWIATGALSFGVLANLEVRVESGALLLDEASAGTRRGLGDTLLGVKYRILDETPARPAGVLAAAVRLPTAGKGLGDDDVDVVALVGASKTFGPLTLTGNVAYQFALGDRDLDVWVLAASLELATTERLTVVAEVVDTEGVDRIGRSVLARAGVVYAVTESLRLDGAVGAGLTSEAPALSVRLGLTLGF